ncbi:CoA-substrate-specific enzyme activase, putative [Sporobacter termitidis DSM 10068]|uniref:CoA-substrate-specific enzyme activase, putative n=1 Tax=Sporobacter termitidis DSM 10068 TaxID=1123282 RepID=A0A1M5XD13_9FIRM|nr:acyl-CoA dehydratase activase [Sporobacter termitidis]SHH97701.1 CoA-substrate-specific enzyme activase, putative [Sporobacter termitidis DSM 10068]
MEVFQHDNLKRNFSPDGKSCFVGVDLGSRTGKAVLLHGDKLFAALTPTGISSVETAELLIGELLRQSGLARENIRRLVGTGYGNVSLSLRGVPVEMITEISCHAKGAHYLCPTARTIIDIGGQDSKAISIDEKTGGVKEFILNDKCAAGTGRFLEKAAYLLELGIDKFSQLSLTADVPCEVSSQCVVFAESEIISLKVTGTTAANIAAGIHLATARKIKNLLRRIPFRPDIFFSGGVANNCGMRSALEDVLGEKVFISTINPVYTGALGAALYASE